MEIKFISKEQMPEYKERVLAFFDKASREIKEKSYNLLANSPVEGCFLVVACEGEKVHGFSYLGTKAAVNGKIFEINMMVGRLITNKETFKSFVKQIKEQNGVRINFIGNRAIQRLARRYGFYPISNQEHQSTIYLDSDVKDN
jgi:hypothetical protein